VTTIPPSAQADVAVVGAGPVGLLVALLLGRRGWQVEVLERQVAAYGRPRAVHLDHEAARILQNAGIMDDLAPQTEVMDCARAGSSAVTAPTAASGSWRPWMSPTITTRPSG
jgi:2-polyprenyl-6-methoxyphenol hydroxylase-like FAD-dependent oxidoreductase